MQLFKKKEKLDEDGKPEEPVKPVRHRKKKEEPPKPWGKIERLIVLIFLISAPLLSIFFFMKSTPKSDVLDPKIVSNILPQNQKDTDELKDELINEFKNVSGTYGIWLQAVSGNYSLGISENDSFDAASLFKLPLMIAYYKAVDNGSIEPNTNYVLKYSDGQAGAGLLANIPVGTAITYHDIVEAMGKNSDSTAFQIISGILPKDSETNTINDLGMRNSNFSDNSTTPKDIGLLFYKLANGNIISNNSKNELLNFLTNTDFENLIPKGLPTGVRVAHKFATDAGAFNDAGIVYTDNPFILVILAKDTNQSDAQLEFPKITKIVYDWSIK